MEKLTPTLFPEFLRNIPQSNQDAQSLAQISGTHDSAAIAALSGCAVMLQTLGIVQFEIADPAGQSMIKATSQTAKYALMSIASYMEAGVPVIEDWKTRGTDNTTPGDLLQNGARFLYALEERRTGLLDHPDAVRIVKASQVLIKRDNPATGVPELLFQYDGNANRYQLIGGRWSEADGDDLRKTMIREIEEELPESALVYERDYTLTILAEDVTLPPLLSPTFGALTEYHFWIYHMQGLKAPLALCADDRWIPVEAVLASDDDDSPYRFEPGDLYEYMNTLVEGGLLQLPSSFAEPSSTR